MEAWIKYVIGVVLGLRGEMKEDLGEVGGKGIVRC
jgi:hypothetical protein